MKAADRRAALSGAFLALLPPARLIRLAREHGIRVAGYRVDKAPHEKLTRALAEVFDEVPSVRKKIVDALEASGVRLQDYSRKSLEEIRKERERAAAGKRADAARLVVSLLGDSRKGANEIAVDLGKTLLGTHAGARAEAHAEAEAGASAGADAGTRAAAERGPGSADRSLHGGGAGPSVDRALVESHAAALGEQVRTLTKRVTELAAERDHLKREVETRSKALHARIEAAARAEAEVQRAKMEIERLRSEVAARKNEVRSLSAATKEAAKGTGAHRTLAERIQALEKDLAAANRDLSESRRAHALLSMRCRDLEDALLEIYLAAEPSRAARTALSRSAASADRPVPPAAVSDVDIAERIALSSAAHHYPAGTEEFLRKIAVNPYVRRIGTRLFENAAGTRLKGIEPGGTIHALYSDGSYGVRIVVLTTARSLSETAWVAREMASLFEGPGRA